MHIKQSKMKHQQSLKMAVIKGQLKCSKTVAPADFLVCFPSRAHLSLMPKQICSPSRPSDAAPKRLHRSTTSPLFASQTGSVDEPTSPKVTCAGQIKVRQKTTAITNTGNNNNKNKNKKSQWLESLAYKRDEFMQCIAAFRGLRFGMQCFGAFSHGLGGCSDEEEEENVAADDVEDEDVGNVFIAKWFMMLDEKELLYEKEFGRGELSCRGVVDSAGPPPTNALLLMRSRSTPGKGGRGEEVVKLCGEVVDHRGSDQLGRSRSWKR